MNNFLMPIIDAHHHFWDLSQNRHPWLQDRPVISFRYGDYSAICRNYLPEDYAADAAGFNIVATVTMEGEWDFADPVGESRWMASMAEQYGMPRAHVARASLDDDNVKKTLTAHASFSLVRGIRHKPETASRDSGASSSLTCSKWRRGFSMLSSFGFSFDLQIPWWHAKDVAELVRTYPQTQIILNHAGLPADRSQKGIAEWRDSMKCMAEAPNIAVKISGIGLLGSPWRYEDNVLIVREIIEIFGTDRCMFASNFPVDKLCGGFGVIFGGYLGMTTDFSYADKRRMFCDNAARIYRLDWNMRQQGE